MYETKDGSDTMLDLMKRLTLIQRAREVFIDCDERFSLIGYMVRLRIFNRGGGLQEREEKIERSPNYSPNPICEAQDYHARYMMYYNISNNDHLVKN